MTVADSPAAVLRRAATVLRERGEKATPGPWEWKTWHCPAIEGGVHHVACEGVDELTHDPGVDPQGFHPLNVLKVPHDSWPPTPADAAWIALANPALAAPLADWLDAAADYCAAGQYAPTSVVHDRALAVARVLLREAT